MDKLRWGLVGCGDIARKRVAPALRDSGELVAIARSDFRQAENFAREFGARRWYRSAEELIADDEIDAVYLATPVHLHEPMTVAAASAGKHVLVEKPMALDVAECERMIRACRAADVRLGVAYYRRFYPVVRRVKELLAGGGAVGRPVLAQINAFEWFDPAPDHPRRWLLERQRSGGGPVFDFGCHRVEMFWHFFGSVRRVQSSLGTILFEREVEDTGVAVIEFESGVRAVLSVTHAAAEPQDTLDVYGSHGSAHVPVLNQGRLTVLSGGNTEVEHLPPHENLHLPLVEDFVRAVRENREPEVDGTAGLEVAKVIAEIYRQPR